LESPSAKLNLTLFLLLAHQCASTAFFRDWSIHRLNPGNDCTPPRELRSCLFLMQTTTTARAIVVIARRASQPVPTRKRYVLMPAFVPTR
jgi:hypothetical protein